MGFSFIKLGKYIGYNEESKTRIIARELEKSGIRVIRLKDATDIWSKLDPYQEFYLGDIKPTHVIVASFRLGKIESPYNVFVVEAEAIESKAAKIRKASMRPSKIVEKKVSSKPAKKGS